MVEEIQHGIGSWRSHINYSLVTSCRSEDSSSHAYFPYLSLYGFGFPIYVCLYINYILIFSLFLSPYYLIVVSSCRTYHLYHDNLLWVCLSAKRDPWERWKLLYVCQTQAHSAGHGSLAVFSCSCQWASANHLEFSVQKQRVNSMQELLLPISYNYHLAQQAVPAGKPTSQERS